MANRLNERLADWATMRATAHWRRSWSQLIGAHARRRRCSITRAGCSPACSIRPGGIKIATIHAFCQSLLRRFPLEAGVPPHFAVIDERSAAEALTAARENVLGAARDGMYSPLAEALAEVVARYASEERFDESDAALAHERGRLRRSAWRRPSTRSRAGSARVLDCAPATPPTAIRRRGLRGRRRR